ncbi:unnamed protein product [Gongylonema pulchrum]|uniref:HECT-type E3 ubiquitin transferase n=1 Tax=Gongylonema pulchrum TaxID=637853 RepID=A0A183DQ39_9BILA|nr:unnamed protein product [Gongylonema pulchrum]
MSSTGSASEQNGDNAAPPHPSRKRLSPNSGGSSSAAPENSSTSAVAAVGSTSSKLRRVAHSSSEQNPGSNELLRRTSSHQAGSSGTAAAGGRGGRAGASGTARSTHESGIRNELKYLTDFFPDQNPGDRRLTRSQRQSSLAGSSNQGTSGNIDHSAPTASASAATEQLRGARDRPRARKGRATVAGRGGAAVAPENTNTPPTTAAAAAAAAAPSSSELQQQQQQQQSSSSSAARTRAHNPATGLCTSVTRCEGAAAVNRVAPASVQQVEQGAAFRSVPPLSVLVQPVTLWKYEFMALQFTQSCFISLHCRILIFACGFVKASNFGLQKCWNSQLSTLAPRADFYALMYYRRCEGAAAVNRVAPASVQQVEQGAAFRSVPPLSVLVQTPLEPSETRVVASGVVVPFGPPLSNASTTAGASEVAARNMSANGDIQAPESQSSQFRNVQRSQPHAASSFLGQLVPRVQHLLGTAHSHPNFIGTLRQQQQRGPAMFVSALYRNFPNEQHARVIQEHLHAVAAALNPVVGKAVFRELIWTFRNAHCCCRKTH